MISKDDFVKYKNQSYFLKLKELASGQYANPYAFKMIFFGGTGAVGGQAVIEVLQAYEYIHRNNDNGTGEHPELVITGIDPGQIDQFCSKMYQVFGKDRFKKINDDPQNPTLLFDDLVELNFQILLASPKFKSDLNSSLKSLATETEKIDFLKSEASRITAPFEEFVISFKKQAGLKPEDKIRAVFSGIPIPSVATYHFEAIDRLLEAHGLSENDTDKQIERSIKQEILKGLAQDFGYIKKRHAEEVLIAHTTSVGGMYQIIDNEAVIKLGYAHSSLGELLKEKQYYANVLSIQYSHFNLKSLVTAAAIGIDYIYESTSLPLSSGVSRKFRFAAEEGLLPLDLDQLKDPQSSKLLNMVFAPKTLTISNTKTDTNTEKFDFGPGKNLQVNYALRSGENGLFSLDNAQALYLNMKIASQEELAHVLVYNAFFGDDRQKPWFDEHGICYYRQTDNSSLIFALLNRREFKNYQTSAFTVKAFQELGSSKHQAELHNSGLYILLHKLKNLRQELITENITHELSETEVMDFVDKNSPALLIEDVVKYGDNISQLGADFARLMTLKSAEDLAGFCRFDLNNATIISYFFKPLLQATKNAIASITSLGTPIIYTDKEGRDILLSGPYFAPLDLINTQADTLNLFLDKEAKKYKLNRETFLEWVICNNGVIDLRPKAVFNTAKTYKEGLKDAIKCCNNAAEFRNLVNELKKKNGRNLRENYHYSSSGLIAYTQRMAGLCEQLESFDLSLGTLNGWKALFPVDDKNQHPLVPGLVEAMRMYAEGLGKITGTEFLYPKYGYFQA